jgi:hypothetical protein
MLFRFVKSQHLASSKLFSLGFSSGNIFYGSSNRAAEHRRAELTAHGHRCDDIVVIARNDHADGRLPVIRAVGRVESARTDVEPDFTAYDTPQLELEFFCGPERIHGLRMRTWRQRDSGWARSYFGNVLHPVVKYHRTVGGCLGK